MRTARRVVVLALGALLVYLAVTFVQVWQASRRDEVQPAQAIVVFGAAQYDGEPSAVLKARLDHAAALYRRKLAGVVVVTGGRQPGDRFSEATASADYLHGKGVPDDDILREVSSHSSWQSLADAAAFLEPRDIRRVLLVSDPFHSLRITAMAGELGLEAHASPTRTSPIDGPSEAWYMARETLAVAAGRLLGYRRVSGAESRVRAAASGM